MKSDVVAWWNGRHKGLKANLSAQEVIPGVELCKFGEGFKLLIPSQASKEEGVETRHRASL